MNELYELLYDHEVSKNNLKELLGLFNEDKFVSFIGAGLSAPLGIGLWKKILQELINMAKNKFSESVEFREEPKEWPQLASEVYNIFEKNDCVVLFYDKLVERLKPTTCSWTAIHYKLVNTFGIYLTTNFDATIEKAFIDIKEKKPNIQCLPDFSLLNLKNESLVYLHGNKTKRIFIFKKEEYDLFYPSVSEIQNGSQVLENFLKEFYKEKCIVFFGFSFEDYYLKEYFKSLPRIIEKEELSKERLYRSSDTEYKRKQFNHFLILSEDTCKRYRDRKIEGFCEEFESINIKPIVYRNDQHIFIDKLLDQLSIKKDNKKPVSLDQKEVSGEI